jgi:hypothetical protein
MLGRQLYYDPDFATNGHTELFTTKRYYVFKHFTRFVFVGSTRYDVSGLPDDVFGLAFRAPSDQTTELGTAKASLILMNMGTSQYSIDFTQTGLGSAIGAVLTDFEYDWQDGSVGNSIGLRGLSIATVLFD